MALREAHSLLGFKTIETRLGSWIGTNALRQSGHHRQDHAGQVLRRVNKVPGMETMGLFPLRLGRRRKCSLPSSASTDLQNSVTELTRSALHPGPSPHIGIPRTPRSNLPGSPTLYTSVA